MPTKPLRPRPNDDAIQRERATNLLFVGLLLVFGGSISKPLSKPAERTVFFWECRGQTSSGEVKWFPIPEVIISKGAAPELCGSK